ncbi:MAG: hypothetical protein WCX13_04840 [Candidatus Hydrogenedentales bacterium]
MTFLDTSETLARILEALPPGHRLQESAMGFTGPAGGILQAEGDAKRVKDAPGWPGELGILAASGNQDDRYLLWLGSRAGMEGRRQLILYPPPGRYRIEYWTKGDGRLEGVEIATSTPLVLGPPGDGPYIVLIRRLT